MRSGAKIVRYPGRSVDQRVHAFWHTRWAKMREQPLALSYETFWPRGLQERGDMRRQAPAHHAKALVTAELNVLIDVAAATGGEFTVTTLTYKL